MLRRYSFAARPGWLAFHLFVVAAIVTMVLLGRWQLRVSDEKHFDIQNFGYSIQWWLFSAFAAFFWWRILRDNARRRDQLAAEAAAAAEAADPAAPTHTAENRPVPAEPQNDQVAYRRYVMPTAPQPPSDPLHAAYNDYLAQLAAKDAETE